MNYVFKILWFEDERPWYNGARREVETFLSGHNLRAEFNWKKGDDFSDADISSNDYDLILMDFALASGETGDKIISRIREHKVLTDILFYSSDYDAMLSAITKIAPPIDGIYYANRKDVLFTPKIESLILKVIRRSEDIINLRGFVLDNTSDFELRIKTLLELAWAKFTSEQQGELDQLMIEEIDKIELFMTDTIKAGREGVPVFQVALQTRLLLSNRHHLDLLQKVIGILEIGHGFPVSCKRKTFSTAYMNKIAKYRVALAHIKADERVVVIDNKQIAVDEAFHQLMRANIQFIEKALSELEDFVSAI
ncbi:hypothetical protein AGMMS50284_4140 [Clostridia bacterium]|nr:hypothetical protein AGMMS50284_4140 [Clostridia bacterium]